MGAIFSVLSLQNQMPSRMREVKSTRDTNQNFCHIHVFDVFKKECSMDKLSGWLRLLVWSRSPLERVIEDFISKADFTKSVCNPLKDLILE